MSKNQNKPTIEQTTNGIKFHLTTPRVKHLGQNEFVATLMTRHINIENVNKSLKMHFGVTIKSVGLTDNDELSVYIA